MARRAERTASKIPDRSPEDYIEIPTGPGMRNEPVIRGKYIPVWVLWAYATQHNMTPEQIRELWPDTLTVDEVRAALQYAEEYPELIEDKTKG